MGTFNARLHDDDPITMEALGAAVIPGGRLVIPQTGATSDPTLQGMIVSGDAAKNVCGVTEHDTVPNSIRSGFESGTAAYDASYVSTDISVPGPTCAVYNDVVGYLNYTAACAFGAKLAAAAAGAVRPWVLADGPDAIVGSCQQPGGVSAAGVALARIRIV
jgi:hypothetical protein